MIQANISRRVALANYFASTLQTELRALRAT